MFSRLGSWGGGYSVIFQVGLCHWDSETLNVHHTDVQLQFAILFETRLDPIPDSRVSIPIQD